MFMGYSTQHAGDVYWFLHLKTNHVIYSRDVQWLGKMWNEFYSIPSNHSADAYVDPFDDYIEDTGTDQETESNVQEVEPTPIETEETILEEEEPIAARTRSHDSEPIASRTRSQQDLTDIAGFADVKTGSNLHEWLNEIAFVTSEMSNPSEPQTFQQAWWHPDLKAREKWHDGIKLEFNKMISMGVWRKVRSTSIPSGRRLVGYCWVFNIKRNRVYHNRLVVKGLSQIPGVDFTDNFSPVVNDVTFRVVLTQMLVEKWDAKIVDIDNAFLNGELEHGVEPFEQKEALRLKEAIYGLVQAARQFFKKIQDSLVQAGFKASEADSCLVYS